MSGGLRKSCGILQLLTRQHAALSVAENDAVSGVNNNPAAIDKDFSDDVLGVVFGREQQQAARIQTGATRKIQESVCSRAANRQQLAVIQGVFGIAKSNLSGCAANGREGPVRIHARMASILASSVEPLGTMASENPLR